MKLEEVKEMLYFKKFNIDKRDECNIFIKRKNKTYNITFKLTEPIPNLICATNVKICTCVTACCGNHRANFIIENKKIFEKEIDKLVKSL